MDQKADLRALMDRLDGYCDFQCEGGPLRNCIEWQQLRAAALRPEEEAAPQALTFAELDTANRSRVTRWHPDGLKSWSALEWAGAMAGEAGEACNAAKKLKRIEDGLKNINDPGRSLTERKDAARQIAKEVADTVIYGALLVAAVDEDLSSALVEVFNKKSEEYGFPERIGVREAQRTPPVPPTEEGK